MILSEKKIDFRKIFQMSPLLTRPLHAGLDAVVQMFHLGGEGHRAEIVFFAFFTWLFNYL
jgi:hypothetical protein